MYSHSTPSLGCSLPRSSPRPGGVTLPGRPRADDPDDMTRPPEHDPTGFSGRTPSHDARMLAISVLRPGRAWFCVRL